MGITAARGHTKVTWNSLEMRWGCRTHLLDCRVICARQIFAIRADLGRTTDQDWATGKPFGERGREGGEGAGASRLLGRVRNERAAPPSFRMRPRRLPCGARRSGVARRCMDCTDVARSAPRTRQPFDGAPRRNGADCESRLLALHVSRCASIFSGVCLAIVVFRRDARGLGREELKGYHNSVSSVLG